MQNSFKAALIAAMVAGAGLATGSAAAQEQFESHTTMMLSAISNRGNDYTVKVVDGEVVEVQVNGEPTEDYEYDLGNDALIIKTDDGERIEVDMAFVNDGRVRFGVNEFPMKPGDNFFEGLVLPDAVNRFPDNSFSITGSFDPPRTMIGITHDSVGEQLRQYLGLEPGEGILVLDVRDDLPADKAGIEPNDIILEIDGEHLDNPEVLFDVLNAHDDGDEVEVEILRHGKHKTLEMRLQKYDAEALGGGRVNLRVKPGFPDVPEMPGVPRLHTWRGGGDPFGGIDMDRLDPEARAQVEEALKQAREEMNRIIEQTEMMRGDMGNRREDMQRLRELLNRGDVLRRSDDDQPVFIERGDRSESRRTRLLEERNHELENRLDRLEERLDRLLEKLEESR